MSFMKSRFFFCLQVFLFCKYLVTFPAALWFWIFKAYFFIYLNYITHRTLILDIQGLLFYLVELHYPPHFDFRYLRLNFYLVELHYPPHLDFGYSRLIFYLLELHYPPHFAFWYSRLSFWLIGLKREWAYLIINHKSCTICLWTHSDGTYGGRYTLPLPTPTHPYPYLPPPTPTPTTTHPYYK